MTGKHVFDSLGVQLYLSGLFEHCETEKQVEQIREQIEGHLEIAADEKLDEIWDQRALDEILEQGNDDKI